MKKKTNSKFDKELLVAKMAQMRISGSSTLTIVRFLMEELQYNRNQAYDIVKDAQIWIMEHMKNESNNVYQDTIARLEELYERGDNKIKMDVIKELNKLRGLYATQKIDLTSGGEKLGEIKLIEVKRDENTGG